MADNTADRSLPREGLIRAEGGGLELREAQNGRGPVLAGHFAVFDEWTEINSVWEGHFLERIAPGAFSKTIKENGDRMRVLFQHGQDGAVGSQPLGRIDALTEDERGAAYEVGLFPSVPPLILDGLRAGQYGSSFRFSVVKEEFERKPEASDHNPNGLPERTITEARVSEFGPVTFPAYAGATAGIRSLTDDFVLPDHVLERLAVAATWTSDSTNPATDEPEQPATTPDEVEEPEQRATTPTSREILYGQKAKEPKPSWHL